VRLRAGWTVRGGIDAVRDRLARGVSRPGSDRAFRPRANARGRLHPRRARLRHSPANRRRGSRSIGKPSSCAICSKAARSGCAGPSRRTGTAGAWAGPPRVAPTKCRSGIGVGEKNVARAARAPQQSTVSRISGPSRAQPSSPSPLRQVRPGRAQRP
jgi:hypothetical protein